MAAEFEETEQTLEEDHQLQLLATRKSLAATIAQYRAASRIQQFVRRKKNNATMRQVGRAELRTAMC